MAWTVWVLVGLCLTLLVVLGVVMQRLYGLQAGLPAQRNKTGISLEFPEGWEKLDELLSLLLNLQEHGVSQSGAMSREDFAKTVLDISCQFMSCARGTVMLWDKAAGGLKIVAAKNLEPGGSRDIVLKAGEGVAGKAFASGQAIFVANPEHDPRFVAAGTQDREPFISIPLLVKAKPIGVLNLHAGKGAESFTGYKTKFLNILAGEAAVMLHNQELLDNLQTFYLEMVQTLARAVDSKDAYTWEHSDRSRAQARRLAAELKLADPMTRYIEYAALLHDIGKIGIPEAILLKPGKLTPQEDAIMRRHAVIGHQILAPIKYLEPVAQMVLYHHERFDGAGYPEGLKGEEIPLGARVVAVIDAWDAMRSDRPYRKALPRQEAVAELRERAGTQFDPRIVEAFLNSADAVDSSAGGERRLPARTT